MHHTDLSDEELVSQLASLCLEGRRLVARVIVHLIAVEDRGLHIKAACDSMWSFCTQRLGMSHGETSRRLNAVKLVRRFPSLLGRIERGEIHLSSLKILGRYLDESNLDAMLDAANGKSKMEVQELVARHFPRPDVPELVVEQHAAPAQASLVAALAIAQVEKERLGKTARPQSKRRPSKPGHIAQETRREVFERDGEQCTYVDAQGNRCESRTRLELDHIVPRAQGGGDEASNLRVTCRPHNKHYAEEIFGKDFVAEKIHCRQRQSQRVMNAVKEEERVISLSPATVNGAPSTPVETIELASKGLVNMGFAKAEVTRALDGICGRHVGEVMRVEALLREAIVSLT